MKTHQFHANHPYAPCMVYLPTFTIHLCHMKVNIHGSANIPSYIPRHRSSYCQRMIRVSNHLLSIVFRRHDNSQKVIGSLGHGTSGKQTPLPKSKMGIFFSRDLDAAEAGWHGPDAHPFLGGMSWHSLPSNIINIGNRMVDTYRGRGQQIDTNRILNNFKHFINDFAHMGPWEDTPNFPKLPHEERNSFINCW